MKGLVKPAVSEIEYSDDLPEELKKQLIKRERKIASDSVPGVVMRLLGENGELGRNELLIGVYRALTEVLTRTNLNNVLNRLKKKGVVMSPTYGRYVLTKKGQELFDGAAGIKS